MDLDPSPAPPSDAAPTKPISTRDALLTLAAINQDVVVLDYANVVIRRGYETLKTVRLLGGGVGGGDLSHATFVGKGMLTAAILGDVACPSSRQILRTIKELNEGVNCGVFVIVQGNTDLFNFGLAVERANADCRTRVKLLAMNDDKTEHKERYTCGYILLTKVLGAMAEEGAFFDDIYKFYQEIVDGIVTVPLHYSFEEIGPQRRKSIALSIDFASDFKQVIDVKSRLDLSLHPSIPTVALINTSKSLDMLTELELIKQVIERLRQWGVSLARLYYGHFLQVAHKTATLTVMQVMDSKIIHYLDTHCGAPGFIQVPQFLPEITLNNEIAGLLRYQGKQQVPFKGAKLREPQSKALNTAVHFACDALISCERQLNIMDAERSDGTVGTRLKTLAKTVNKKLNSKKLPTDCPYTFFKKLGVLSETVLGGSMGSIYGLLFENAAAIFEDIAENEEVSCFAWFKALSFANSAVQKYCVNQKAELNMFYPLKCCEMAITREFEKDQHYMPCYAFGVSTAEEAAQRTKRAHKYPDPGAHAVGIWMRALFEGVKLMTASNVCDNDAMM